MSGDDNPKRKKRGLIKLILLLIVFAIIAVLVVSLISWNRTGSSWLTNLFSPRPSEISVDEFNFDIGRSRMFANMDSSIAAVGTLGLKVLDFEGRETLRDPFRMTQPAIISSEGRGVAFDIGGSSVRVFSNSQVISSIETDGTVVSASINQNGWFCIVTQESGASRGIVTVYNSSGTAVFRASKGTGFVLAAELSHDNRSLAILNYTGTGSRISFYHGIDADKDPDQTFDYTSGLIIDIKYLTSGDVLAVTTDSLFLVELSGSGKMLYAFPEKRLGGYASDADFIVLHLYDYGIGHQGRLITLNINGTILGETTISREIISMSVADKSIAVLKNDGVVFYNEVLEEFSASAENISAAGASRVLAVSENAALATSDNSAIIVRADTDDSLREE